MFQLIKTQINIVRHVEKYTQLRQSGRTLHGKCPLHEDDTPSFIVYPDSNSYFCFGCNSGGSVIDFEVSRQKVSPLDAAKYLCDEYNIHPTPADTFRYQQQLQIRKKKEDWLEALTDSFSGRADIHDYIKNRGLSEATIKTFQLGAGSSTNVVVIPINDKFGKVVGFARRNLDKDAKEKYLNDPSDMVYNKSEILYNFDRAKKYIINDNAMIINEGFFDVFSLWEAGIKTGVAFCSSRITRDQSKAISETIDENGVVYLVPTNDPAGQDNLEKNSEQIKVLCPKNTQRVLIIPEDCKDLNDVLIKHGKDKIKDMYERSYPIELYCVQRLLKKEERVEVQYSMVRNYCMKIDNAMVFDDLCDFLSAHWNKSPDSIKSFLLTKNVKDAVDNSQFKTMPMLIADYDKYVTTLKENRINFGWVKTDMVTRGMRVGDVIQLVASSGVGKTLWAENLITNLVKSYPDLPLIFFSLEQLGVMAFERFAMMEGQLESHQVEQWNNNPDADIQKRIVQTISMLAEKYKNFVLIDEGGMTMAKLEQYVTHAGMMVFDRPVKIIVIDYMGYLQGEGKDLYHKISAISKELKELAKKLKCVIISLHQVSKAGKSGGDPIEAHMARDSVTGDSRVLLADGSYVPIDSLIGKIPEVISIDKNYKFLNSKSDYVWKKGKRDILKFTTQMGKSIKVTECHPFLTADRGWIKAQQLKVGDRIGTVRNVNIFGNEDVPHAEFLGHLIADGGLTHTPIEYTDGNDSVRNHVYDLAKKMGISAKIHKGEHRTLSFSTDDWQYNHLTEWIRKLGLNVKSPQRFVPQEIFRAKKQYVVDFIRGYWSSDGCVTNRGLKVVSASERLLRDISHLLSRFGIYSFFEKGFYGNGGYKKAGEPYWQISIRRIEHIQKFMNEIGLSGDKMDKLKKLFGGVYNKPYNNFDVFPVSLWDTIRRIRKNNGIHCFGDNRIAWKPTRIDHDISRDKLNRIAQLLKSDELQKLSIGDVLFDKIVNIEKLPPDIVYDISVSDYQNFLANDIYVHNSGVVVESADIMISAWRPELKEGITDAEKQDLEGIYITKIVKNRYGLSGVQIEFMFVKQYLKLYEKRDEPLPVTEQGKIG